LAQEWVPGRLGVGLASERELQMEKSWDKVTGQWWAQGKARCSGVGLALGKGHGSAPG